MSGTGFAVDVQPIYEIGPLDTYGAVVLGSAVHNMAGLPQAAAFVRTYATDLARRPVRLFSVSSVGDTSSFFGPRVARFLRRMRKESKDVAAFRQATKAWEQRNFSGAIAPSHWPLTGRLFLTIFGGHYGDHRDWHDIDTFADRIARQLLASEQVASA